MLGRGNYASINPRNVGYTMLGAKVKKQKAVFDPRVEF